MTTPSRFIPIRVAVLAVLATPLCACTGPLAGRTPPIEVSDRARDAVAIAMLPEVVLGGAKQRVLVRGADRSRPIVLFLHGGPGMPSMYLAHAFQRSLEKEFVMVHWDRRGAGKSYGARYPIDSLTVRRTLDDLYELRSWLRHNVGDNRVILVGHSWGSYLGMLAVRERPQEFGAYVATGVLSPDSVARRNAQRKCVAVHAAVSGDTALARQLEAPPSDSTPRITEDMLFRVGGELRLSRSVWKIIRTGLSAPEYTFRDVLNVRKGASFVGRHMRYDVDDGWLITDPTVEVPIVFALGRHDCNTPSEAAASWFAQINAPWKSIVWLESSAHFPFWEEPARFGEALRQANRAAASAEGR